MKYQKPSWTPTHTPKCTICGKNAAIICQGQCVRCEEHALVEIETAKDKAFQTGFAAGVKSVGKGLVELDEKSLKKWFEDNRWHNRFGTSFSDLVLMNDFIKSICSHFRTKPVPRPLPSVEEIKDAIDKGFDTYDGCEALGRDVAKHHIAQAIHALLCGKGEK